MNIKDFILNLAEDTKDNAIAKLSARVRRSKGTERERPNRNSTLYWDIYRTDALAGAGIDYTINFVCGAGFDVRILDDEGNEQDLPWFDKMLRNSKPKQKTIEFLKDGLIEGDGYMYLQESETADDWYAGFDVIPATQVRIERDEFNNIKQFVQEVGQGEDDYPTFEPNRVAHYRNRPISGEAYGRSDIEPIVEASEILRDMQIDLANFISTKAYPPILWKLGNSEQPWGANLVEEWAKTREEIEPGDQISVQGDVSYEAVGVSSETLDVQPYLLFFASLVVSGLRVPAALTSLIKDMGQFTADSQANAYARRINDLRQQLAEILEVDVFNRILRQNNAGQYHAEVVWRKHDDEAERMAVNNVVQLVQNGIISDTEARESVGYPQVVKGELKKPVDKPENVEPAIPNESNQNTSDDVTEDNRTGSKRMEATDET
jgi:hypothetical protein